MNKYSSLPTAEPHGGASRISVAEGQHVLVSTEECWREYLAGPRPLGSGEGSGGSRGGLAVADPDSKPITPRPKVRILHP